jgi:hypothetical protein
LACRINRTPVYDDIQLPSGERIIVTVFEKIFFKEYRPTLCSHYETDQDVNDSPALRNEINQIWQVFQKEVERESFIRALIQANRTYKFLGIESKNSWGYVFEPGSDGKWSCSNGFEKLW